MNTYTGSCHCGHIKFSFQHDEIDSGLRCNCSLCRRKGALMSSFILPAAGLRIDAKPGSLGLYQFGNSVAKHYFCKTCGIYPFHETLRKPGHFRVNLGCIDDLDSYNLPVEIFNGKSL